MFLQSESLFIVLLNQDYEPSSRYSRLLTIAFVSDLAQFKTNELFDFMKLTMKDRWSLQHRPNIWPRVISLAEKQHFYIYRRIRQRLPCNGPHRALLPMRRISVWDYTRSLQPQPESYGYHSRRYWIALIVDDETHMQTGVSFSKSEFQAYSLMPANGVAVAVSSETDEVMIL